MKCPNCQTDISDAIKFCGECGLRLSPPKEVTAPYSKTLILPIQELSRGTLFANRFEIIEELGKGGMGNVYRVEDRTTNEEVALKLIKPENASDPSTIERFRNELITARKIRHKNICGMYDFGEENEIYYITMEYVKGEDLKSFMRRSKQISIPTAISIAQQLCEGLSEAHRLGVVHRDLKPNNIMIDTDGNARIMDFGIAQSLKTKGLTESGIMIGTPEYMSPEQVEGIEVDSRSDIYSLGIILYELVTGSVPFEGNTPMSVALMRMLQSPAEPKKISSQISGELSKVIMTCLNKDKNKRYQSTKELLFDLKEIESQFPTTDKVIPKSKSRETKEIAVSFKPKKILIIVASISMAAVTGILIWLLMLKPDRQTNVIPASLKTEPTITVAKIQEPELKPAEKIPQEKKQETISQVSTSQTPEKKVVQNKIAASPKKTAEKPQKKEQEISLNLKQAQTAFDKQDFQASVDLSRKILKLDPDHAEAAKITKLAEQKLTSAYIVNLIGQYNSAVKNKILPEFYQKACTAEFYQKIKKDAELIINTYESLKSVTSDNSLEFIEDDFVKVTFPNITMGVLKQGRRQHVLFEGIYIWEMKKNENIWKIISIKTAAIKKSIKKEKT